VLGRVPDPARKAALQNAADAKARQMWAGFVRRKGNDPAALGAAVAGMSAMKVSGTEVAALPTWARYNLARFALSQGVEAAAKLTGAPRDQAQRTAMTEFAAAAQGLDVASSQAPAALLASIKELGDKGSQLDLSKLGPGARGWKFVENPDPDAAIYIWNAPSGAEHRLEFRRVSVDSTDDVSFVATTETSVGLFADAVTAASAWNDVRGLMPIAALEASGPPLGRGGPHAWVWVRAVIVPSPVKGVGDLSGGWVRIDPKMAGQAYYPAGVTAESPSAMSPMQQLSAHAAVLAARAMGCRIPSSAEWRAAKATDTGSAHNLRDGTWQKVYDHLLPSIANSPEFPAAGIFLPAGMTRVQPAADRAAAVEAEDGWVWFWPVSTGTVGFKSLVGNVAEFTFEEPVALETVAATAADVDRVLGKSDKMRVIGASALSPKEVKPDEAYSLSAGKGKESYSDVGFRVAFSAPRAAGAAGVGERLKSALEASGYLPPK